MKPERPRSSGSFVRYAQPAVASVKGYCQSAASAWSSRNEDDSSYRTHDNCGPWQTKGRLVTDGTNRAQ